MSETFQLVDTSGCSSDPKDNAFDDVQRVEGCRLVLSAWPETKLPIPEPGDGWQNRIAYAVFNSEAALAPGEVLPWESVGLAIGLIGFDPTGVPLFLDRHAVARAGGTPRPRSGVAPGLGLTPLWQ